MIIRHVKISTEKDESIRVTREVVSHFYNPLHFHDKIELTYIIQSSGMSIIGNHIGSFKPGDIFLIGKNLGHEFRNSLEHNQDSKAEALVIHFSYDFFEKTLFEIPELSNIKELLQLSERGIEVGEGIRLELGKELLKLQDVTSGFKKVFSLLSILENIANSSKYKVLSGELEKAKFNLSDSKRLEKITSYLMNNYHQKITLDEVSKFSNMAPSTFCRYFKTRTKKTYTQFLNELRVECACDLLTNTERSVQEICFDSGFENLSYFYRAFKKIKNKSPYQYKKSFLN